MIETRRYFLHFCLIAAPAIVCAANIMPVRAFTTPEEIDAGEITASLLARLDFYEGQEDPNIYRRYASYDPLGFDSDSREWKSAAAIYLANDVEARRQLILLKLPA